MTSASPTVWPHCDEPEPRGKIGIFSSAAIAMALATSESVLGTTTPIGSI